MENIGGVVWCFPAFGQVGLDSEDAWLHLWANLMSHQLTVDKAQRGVGLEANRLMRVKVHRVIATHAQDTAALGLSSFSTPEHRRARERQGRQCHASHKAGLEQITTVHALRIRDLPAVFA